jgi:glucosamine--fructose-6-phosphate aminotransferase (isomerizing)
MCGIFGYVTNKEEALGPILIAAAERFTYRGYDSVGAATINDGKIDLRKDTGKVDSVAAKYNIAEMRGQRGITQLRWATFGEPSQVNSQPHLDSNGDMVGAHNGNVVNNVELREQFIAEGMTVRSQNDGETCVHAVERYINRGYEFIDAIRLAYGDLEGDYAFVIGRANDDKLYAFKKGSGMVIGLGEGFTCVSSDLPSILPLTREVIRPQDGEIVTLWADKVEVRSVKDGKLIEGNQETVTESMDAVQKGGYPHFMLKEIHEQSQVARELSHVLNGNREVEHVGREDEERASFVFHRMRHELSRRVGGSGLFCATGGARPSSPCSRRSSSRNTRRRSIMRTWAFSSANRARPRMCSTRWKRRRKKAWRVSDWRTWSAQR